MYINSADDFINPPELSIAEREIKRVPHGQFHLLPISDQTRGHATQVATVWNQYLETLGVGAETVIEGSHDEQAVHSWGRGANLNTILLILAALAISLGISARAGCASAATTASSQRNASLDAAMAPLRHRELQGSSDLTRRAAGGLGAVSS